MKKFFGGFIVGIMVMLCTTVFAAYNVQTIDVVMGKVKVIVDGVAVNQETLLYNGYTYVPLRAAGEALGMDVSYDAENSIAYFKSKKSTTETTTKKLTKKTTTTEPTTRVTTTKRETTTETTTRETTTKRETTTEATTKETTTKSSLPKIPSKKVYIVDRGKSFEGRFDFKVISEQMDYYVVECSAVGELRGGTQVACSIYFYDSQGYLIEDRMYLIKGSGAVKTKETIHMPKEAAKYSIQSD